MRRVDAGVDHRPADGVAAHVEQQRRGIGLDRVARAPQRRSRRAVAVDRPQQRATRRRQAAQVAERLGGEVDEQVVGQARGRLLVGLVVVGVLLLPGDPPDQADEPDQRARQLVRVDGAAALLAHRLLEAADDVVATLAQHGGDGDRVRRPEVLLPPLRERQNAAQQLAEGQPDRDVRRVVGKLQRRGIGGAVVGVEHGLRELGGRRLGMRLEQEVDCRPRLAAVLQPDVGHDRRVLGEALELLGAEDPRPQVLELELHGPQHTVRPGRSQGRSARRSCSCSGLSGFSQRSARRRRPARPRSAACGSSRRARSRRARSGRSAGSPGGRR